MAPDAVTTYPIEIPEALRAVIKGLAISDRGDVLVVYAKPMIVTQIEMDDRDTLFHAVALRRLQVNGRIAPEPEPWPKLRLPHDLCKLCGKRRNDHKQRHIFVEA